MVILNVIGYILYYCVQEAFWIVIGGLAGLLGPALGCFVLGPGLRKLLGFGPFPAGSDPGNAWGFVIILSTLASALISGVVATACVVY